MTHRPGGLIRRRLAVALAHPLTRGLDIDDPATTALRRQVLLAKPFLRHIYLDWYRALAGAVPPGPERLLEIGAGAGFTEDVLPTVVRSDVLPTPHIEIVLDALALPFREGSLRAIVMTNVLHHVPDPARFFAQAASAVRPGGTIAMIEPWLTSWSSLIYTRLHHEPFVPDAGWTIEGFGPLSRANDALAWILFERDRRRFDEECPEWALERVEPMMPLRYLVSGGISLRNLMPGWTTPAWRVVEHALHPFRRHLGMFALIVLRRRDTRAASDTRRDDV